MNWPHQATERGGDASGTFGGTVDRRIDSADFAAPWIALLALYLQDPTVRGHVAERHFSSVPELVESITSWKTADLNCFQSGFRTLTTSARETQR